MKGAIKIKLIQRIFIIWAIALGWTFIGQLVEFFLGFVSFTMPISGMYPMQLLLLYSEGIGILAMALHYRHKPDLLGFSGEHIGKNLVAGTVAGLLLFSLIWLIVTLLGGYHVTTVFHWHQVFWLILFLFGYGVQATFEEIVCRGYIMGYWLKHNRLGLAFLTNALFFTVLHVANPGYDLYAMIGLFLFSIAMSALRLLTGSIWLGCAFHAIWNFAEGCIFGTSVSGLSSTGLVFISTNTTPAQLLTGGSFGIERSGIALIAYGLVSILLIALSWPRITRAIDDRRSAAHS